MLVGNAVVSGLSAAKMVLTEAQFTQPLTETWNKK